MMAKQARPGRGREDGSALNPRGGEDDLTWPEPQSHSSPASTKPFPQRLGSTRLPGAGETLERHVPPPLRKKVRSWRRLQALKTRGKGCLQMEDDAVGGAGTIWGAGTTSLAQAATALWAPRLATKPPRCAVFS